MRIGFVGSLSRGFIGAGVVFGLLGAGSSALAQGIQASCELTFPGGTAACRDYTGTDWTAETAAADCADVLGATGPGELVVGASCDDTGIVGSCMVGGGSGDESLLQLYAGDPETLQGFCEGPLGGQWLGAVTAVARCDYAQVAGPPGVPAIATCRAYSGSGWEVATAAADCAVLERSEFVPDAGCPPPTVGSCSIGEGNSDAIVESYSEGGPAALEAGCGFAGGVWTSALPPEDQVMAEAVTALVSDARVTVVPDSCDPSCRVELAETDGWIEFRPEGSVRGGVVFYGGGGIDPRAYAAWARKVAEAGLFVALPAFTGNAAILDPFRANSIVASHPEIGSWVMVGHSLGAVAASIYADVDPLGKIEAISLWAGYPPNQGDTIVDLRDNPIRVSMVRGDLDSVLDLDAFNDGITRTPANTAVIVLRGGNHAQFGYYGEQGGDQVAQISRAHQTDLAVATVLHLAAHFGLDPLQNFIDPIYGALGYDRSRVCALMQRRLAGFSVRDLSSRDVRVRHFATLGQLREYQPVFPPDDEAELIEVGSNIGQVANNSDITAPAIMDGEFQCKMKSQEAIADRYGLTPFYEEKPCARANSDVFRYAMVHVGWRGLFDYLRSGTELFFSDDFMARNGPQWLDRGVELQSTGDGEFALSASRLWTPLSVPGMPPQFLGANYCRVWSFEAAIRFIKEQGRR